VTSDNCNHMLFIILSMCHLHFQNVQMCIFMFTCTHIHMCMYIHVICTCLSSSSKPHGRGANNSTMKPHKLFLAQRTLKCSLRNLLEIQNLTCIFKNNNLFKKNNNLWIWSLLKYIFRKIIIIYKYSH